MIAWCNRTAYPDSQRGQTLTSKTTAPDRTRDRTDLESRISEVERRLAGVARLRTAPDDRIDELESQLAQLRQATTDLAADNRDLHNLLDRLVSTCERLLAGGGGASAVVRRGGGLRRAGSLIGHTARKALGGAVWMARRFVGSRRSREPSALEVRVELASQTVSRSPRLAVVVRFADDLDAVAPDEVVKRQTDSGFDLVVWNEDRSAAVLHPRGSEPRTLAASDRAALSAALAAELIADVGDAGRSLHPTIIERCRWVVASERVPLLVGAVTAGSRWKVEPKERWAGTSPDRHGTGRPRLIKAVGTGGWGAHAEAHRASSGSGMGRGYIALRGTHGITDHRVRPVGGLVEPFPVTDGRPAVLVVTSGRGFGPATWLVGQLRGEFRFTVVATEGADGAPPIRALSDLAERTYPIGGFLEPEVWPSLIADLARAHEARTILRIDPGFKVPRDENGPRVVDMPVEAGRGVDDPDVVIALGGAIAADARMRGFEVVEVIPGPLLRGELPTPAELDGVRSAHGVPGDASLVLTVCNLEPDHRPEDVAAVARRLDHRRDVHVLLVGRGRLAGAVSDLADYFALDRFAVSPPGIGLKELVAASDCVLSTAEMDPWPVSVAAALALGRNVVATEIDGVRELCAAARFDRCTLCQPGDVDSLAAAVVDALQTNRRPRLTHKAWKAATHRSEAAARAVAGVLHGSVGGGQEEA